MTPAPSATLRGFGYHYPQWTTAGPAVLRDVDLTLGEGLTLVCGDSGSGKSTLLRVLNGLVPHFHGGSVRGAARVCELDVLATPTRRLARHVGFVFQEAESGFVRGTVAREVAFGPENLGTAPEAIGRLVGDALDRVGIAALAGRRIRTLSGGERQRVALAAVLASAPSILAMDEPMAQLDDEGAAGLAAVVAELAAEGRTVVVAEHRTGRFAPSARSITVLDGQVVEGPSRAERNPGPEVGPPCSRMPGRGANGSTAWSLDQVTIGIAGRVLLSEVELCGAAGEVVLVTGANGAGKTTLLRTIAGLHPPLSGRVERRPGRVAYLPQEPGLLLHRQSVRAEVEQTLRWTGASGGPKEILELLGLVDLAEHDPRDLSVGERQRAALATVLAGEPLLALLDEPTRGMDAKARRGLAVVVRRLADAGAAVVLATHDTELASELPGRLVRVEAGGIVEAAE